MSLTGFELPPPNTWQAFEALCHDLFASIWATDNAQRIGRNGQRQHGVDIVANVRSELIGVQCKRVSRGSELSREQLRSIADEATRFRPPLSRLILTTTQDNDAGLQEEARLISEDHRQRGLFEVEILGWGNLVAQLDRHPDVVTRHYAALEHFSQSATSTQTNYSTRIASFAHYYWREGDEDSLFVGRDAELTSLDEWLADDERPIELIRAPAGRGKSALLANWVAGLGDSIAVIYMPISARFRTNLAHVVFTSLLSRLAAFHGCKLAMPSETDLEQTRGLIADFLARPLLDGDRLLVVIDGLDEAADFEILPDLLPATSPTGLKIILAGRPTGRRSDPFDHLVLRPRNLSLLSDEAVRRASIDAGANPNLAAEIVRMVEGDPLLLRLYLGSLRAGELDERKLPGVTPGLRGFFGRWWEDQLELWRNRATVELALIESLLSVLACALGPLAREDLLDPALVPECPSVLQLDAALIALNRLLAGDGRSNDLVLSHPRFAEFIREEWLPASRRQEVERRFISWGDVALSKASESRISTYLISNLAAHLERAGASQAQYEALTTRAAADRWYALDPSLSGFLSDVDRRRRAASADVTRTGLNATLLGALVSCALTTSTVRTIANSLHPMIYVAAMRLGLWSTETVFEHIAKVRGDRMTSSALAEIARVVGSGNSSAVLDVALSIGNPHLRASALREILPYLKAEDRHRALAKLRADNLSSEGWFDLAPPIPTEDAIHIAEQLNDATKRALALAKLLPSMPDPDREVIEGKIEELIGSNLRSASDQLVYVGGVQNLSPERRQRLIAKILSNLSDDLEKYSAIKEISFGEDADLLDPLIDCAASIDDQWRRGDALVAIAPMIDEDHIDRFVSIASAIEKPLPRAQSLGALCKKQQGPWCSTALELCRTADFFHASRAPILVDVSHQLSDQERLELEPHLLKDLNTPVDPRAWDQHDPGWLLADFADTFLRRRPKEALRLIAQIDNEGIRARKAAEYAARGPKRIREAAIELLRSVDWPSDRIDGFILLADLVPSDQRASICAEIADWASRNGYSSYFVEAVSESGWDVETEIGLGPVQEALALHRVTDWHELGHALSALAPGATGEAAADALATIKSVGYELSITSVIRAFADRFTEKELLALLEAGRKMPDRSFATSILEEIIPHLPNEIKGETVKWAFELPETTDIEIEQKLRTLSALAPPYRRRGSTLIQKINGLAARLPEQKRKDVLFLIDHRTRKKKGVRRMSPKADRYSRVALLQEVSSWRESRFGNHDTFVLLAEQDKDEMQGAIVDVLRVASTQDRSTVLTALSNMASALFREAGTDGVGEVIKAIRNNVDSWG